MLWTSTLNYKIYWNVLALNGKLEAFLETFMSFNGNIGILMNFML